MTLGYWKLVRWLQPTLVILCLFGYHARAADTQPYQVGFASTGNGDMDDTLEATSDLQTLRKSAPVSPFGLIARARSDIDRFTTVLESYGYYQSGVTIKINGLPLKDSKLRDTLSALPSGAEARVEVSFTLGPQYHLRKIEIDGDVPESVRSTLGLKPGDAALASTVLAGGARMLNALLEQGYAFAKVDAPVAYEAAEEPALDLNFHVVTGPRVNVGEIHIEGQKRTHEALLRRTLRVRTGDPYRLSAIERGRRDLLALGVFDLVTVQVGSAVDATGGVPITFKLRERKRHAASFSAAYSSDLGGSGGVTWTDRNLFGNAETLSINATAIGIDGTDTSNLGYDTSVKFTKPDFLRRDQSLQLSIGALKQFLDAYDQTAVTAGAAVTRKLSSVWSASIGLTAVDEKIDQVVGVIPNPDYPADPTQPQTIEQRTTTFYTLLALPLIMSYDSTNLPTPLDDPRHGFRGSLSVTPTLAIAKPNQTFTILQFKLAGYYDLNKLFGTDPGRSVLAARILEGVAKGASEFSLPPDQRFYGGGSSTIRGYRYQSVGPQFPGTNDPIGGTEIEAGSIEFRQRFAGNFGAAAFVDGGQVTASAGGVPNDFRIGVGLGLRYYTPIGPIRVDVAVPTKKRSGDDDFELYIGLGQAF
jgi:translocation and assembly module TamA